MVPLADACAITMGQAPSGDSYNDRGEGLPLIAGAGDFKGAALAPSKFTTKPTRVSAAGDIVLSIRASIGAKVRADGEYCLGRGVAGLRPGSELDDGYLWHWLTRYERELASKGRGATFLQVNKTDIGEMLIQLPPLDEQHRIAAILDHADALRAKRRQVLAHLDSLTQSIFQKRFGHMDPKVELQAVCTKVTDGTHQSPMWADEGVPFLFVSNITRGEIETTTQRFISFDTWSELTRRTPIEVGDLLYSTVGSFGIPALVRSDEPFAFQRHIAHIKPDRAKVDSTFLGAQLKSPLVRRQAVRAARGVAQPTVNLADIKRFAVVVPPIADQRAFANEAEAVRTQQLAMRLVSSREDALFASLQSRAFRGEL
ncbi:MAG: restriction endonuclease subunit S [Nocardioides sp.]|jgi:type I restriction enzyme S subunit